MTTADKTKQFFAAYPTRLYRRGETIVQAGDMPAVYYIAEGQIAQYDISDGGAKLVLNIYKSGAFISLACIFNDIPSAFFFEANASSTLHQAPRADVVAWLHDNPDIVYDALARISRGSDGLMLRLARAMEGDAESRVLQELMILRDRFPTSDGTVKISDTELAAQTGLARETVSRVLSRLRRRGIVATTRGHIRLVNPR